MPFTVSHVAAILPLHKPLRRLGLLSAAAIGAMAPDLDLLLPTRLPRDQTHTPWSLLTFSLPVGLAGWVLFQALIKPALIEVLPDRVYLRLCSQHLADRLGSFRTWLLATLAILLGALTHIVWDSFTHEDGQGVRLLPELGQPGPEVAGAQWGLYRWMQHGSSVVGMMAVIVALWIWARHAGRPEAPPERRLGVRERRRWLALYLMIPLLEVLIAIMQIHHRGWPRLYSTAALTHLAVTAMRGAILGLVFASALVRRRLLLLELG